MIGNTKLWKCRDMSSDEVMVTVDKFSLIAPDGSVFASKRKPEHLKVVFDDYMSGIPKDERVYPWEVVSRETVFRLKITAETTQADWREFSGKCEMVLD